MSVLEEFDARRALRAGGALAQFNAAGVLAAADVHVAAAFGIDDEDVALAVALAVRGPRLGHVLVDLERIRETAAVDTDETVELAALPWPEPESWIERLARSRLVAVGDDAPQPDRPLRLVGSSLYLDRYWREERQVAADLRALAQPATGVDEAVLADGIARLFAGETDGRQAEAAAAAVRQRLAVVAGGPGTGKTTTAARIVALLAEQAAAAGAPPPLVALAAPTGKAAARLQEAVHEAVPDLPVDDAVREQLLGLEASTLHRLLGWRPGSHSRFRHDRRNRLPYDVVLVDETSMVSLSLMARLVEAIRAGARLILVGDPGQLASIEAGVVLGDIVGPGTAEGIVVLDRVRRFAGPIADVAAAVRSGDADAVVEALRTESGDVTWIEDDGGEELIRASAVDSMGAVLDAARAGDGQKALGALGAFRLLCAHRRGPHGVASWTERIERWLAEDLEHFETDARWYVGRPLLITRNDAALRLYNGDTGVVVATGDGVAAAFLRGNEVVTVRPGRLEAVESVYAMTIHKSQGSQFGTVAVVLPPPDSPILTRQLLYTAVTRAQTRLVVVGGEDSVRTAVGRPAARASGLAQRLWG